MGATCKIAVEECSIFAVNFPYHSFTWFWLPSSFMRKSRISRFYQSRYFALYFLIRNFLIRDFHILPNGSRHRLDLKTLFLCWPFFGGHLFDQLLWSIFQSSFTHITQYLMEIWTHRSRGKTFISPQLYHQATAAVLLHFFSD